MMASEARYQTLLKLASGGMATVYVGTVRGALGFRQLVAIKRPHPHLLADPEYKRELIAEARLASMIHHANVVDVRDVEVVGDAVSLVMDYIEGASLGDLLVAASKGGPRVTPGVAVRIALDALAGLQAAHDLTDERGRPVGLVHRDISPQNILVGLDGVARVTDFGVAKFSRKGGPSTSEGSLKGKLAYMAPEYLRGEEIDRRFDVFAVGVVLWEAFTGKRLFRGEHEADTLQKVLFHRVDAASATTPEVAALDAVLEAALSRDREARFQNAQAMANALERAARAADLVAGHTDVAALVKAAVGAELEDRRTKVRARLAAEPSVASLFTGTEAPNIPSTIPDPSAPVASPPLDPTARQQAAALAPTLLASPPAQIAAPPVAPGAPPTVAASTLRSENALAAAPAASTLPSAFEAPEAIRPGDSAGFPIEPSLRGYGVTGVETPRPKPARTGLVVGLLVAVGVVGAAAAVVAMRWPRSATTTLAPSSATVAPSALASATGSAIDPTPSSTVAQATSASAPSATAPVASVSATIPRGQPKLPGAKSSAKIPAAPPSNPYPPPNPYNQK